MTPEPTVAFHPISGLIFKCLCCIIFSILLFVVLSSFIICSRFLHSFNQQHHDGMTLPPYPISSSVTAHATIIVFTFFVSAVCFSRDLFLLSCRNLGSTSARIATSPSRIYPLAFSLPLVLLPGLELQLATSCSTCSHCTWRGPSKDLASTPLYSESPR